ATAINDKLVGKVASPAEWVKARRELLTKEKEFTRLRDELSRRRRELPWEKVDKPYTFDGPRGKESLADLFEGRSQLIVYHFMFGPDWKEGCPSCSFLADSFDGSPIHMAQRDVTFVVVSRASLAQIEAFKKRMGWHFKWVSSGSTDFNFDYQVSSKKGEAAGDKVYYNYELTDFPSDERPGASVFYKDQDGQIFHTYSTYGRGLDILLNAYNFLDMTPRGRHEEGLPHGMSWVKHHDRYGSAALTSIGSAGEKRPAVSATLDPMLKEFRGEVETTRRILKRIPADKLAWQPHPKSMTLGQLANHIAMVPGRISQMAQLDGFDASQANFMPPQPASLDEVLTTFEQSVLDAEACLASMSDDAANEAWRLTAGGKEIFTQPRVNVLRSILLNHWYHHRGQLSVYLRLLNVPVPVIYGRSADENPFA
ncbi:MAG TPA: DinB family protein, partial [Terriglobales bacterium]|nr:DinB family protein [Terriglobales bacterium]